MGREIRMVPPNWDHPVVVRRNGQPGYKPMHNSSFRTASQEWKQGFAAWERGERPDYCSEESKSLEYWEWSGGPPERTDHRPWSDDEATWYQVWETVSEGTPVSPPFATREELVEYLVANGDFWDQSRRKEGRTPPEQCAPWSRKAAEAFVFGAGYAPSLVMDSRGVRSEVQALGE